MWFQVQLLLLRWHVFIADPSSSLLEELTAKYGELKYMAGNTTERAWILVWIWQPRIVRCQFLAVLLGIDDNSIINIGTITLSLVMGRLGRFLWNCEIQLSHESSIIIIFLQHFSTPRNILINIGKSWNSNRFRGRQSFTFHLNSSRSTPSLRLSASKSALVSDHAVEIKKMKSWVEQQLQLAKMAIQVCRPKTLLSIAILTLPPCRQII